MARRSNEAKGEGSVTHSVLILGTRSHVGMKRSSNQDAICALVGPNAPPGTDALLAVADGMGGHQAGEVASALAIRGLVSKLSGGLATRGTGGLVPVLQRAMGELNTEIHEAGHRPETRGMGTTLTAAVIVGDALTIGHVGDSRAYLLRDGTMRQLTLDHSWVAEQVAQGVLTPQEAQEHPRRNILTRAMGVDPRVQVDGVTMKLVVGDVLLLCSDGLHGLVSDDKTAKVLNSQDPGPASQEMVDLANANGGTDNISVVVAQFGGVGPSSSAHGRTTLAASARLSRKLGLLGITTRVLFLPAWFPFWLLHRLFIAPFRRRR